jgi:hypothetical protein
MYIYSGTCKLCECGRDASITDIDGLKLFTGDIIVIYTVDENGILGYIGGLTAIVSNDFKNYLGKVPYFSELAYPFVMGLKSIVFSEEWESWAIKRVKSYLDVMPGEKWVEYGFNYRED